MCPNALSCICAYTDAEVIEPVAPCAAWPIVNFSNFALNKLAYNIRSKEDLILFMHELML